MNSIVVALAARRTGALWTTATTISIAFALLIGYAVVTGLRFQVGTGEYALLAALAATASASFLASYRSLELGPLSVVSPISATTGAMTVLFAFVFVGERPSATQWCGIPVAVAGAVCVSLRSGSGMRYGLIGAGGLFAALGVLTGAVSNAGLRAPIREIGPVQAILVQRAFTVVYVWLVLLAVFGRRKRRRPASREHARSTIGLLATAGLLDSVSFIAFAKGLEVAPAWQVGLLSQSGRAIAVIGGLVLFHEHLERRQWVGIGLMGVGLALAVLG